MQSISDATCSLGLITFAIRRQIELSHHRETWRWSTEKEWNPARVFASATEELLEVHEILDTSPHNPIAQLPPGLNQTAERCATDVERMRKQIRTWNVSEYFALRLNGEELGAMTSVLRSHAVILRPHAKSLARYV
jgi:hypothetical protein